MARRSRKKPAKPRRPKPRSMWPAAWKRNPLVAAVVLAVLALLVWQRQRVPQGNDVTRYHNQTFRAIRAVDGDTLDINAPDNGREYTRIRLIGVDTPETSHSPGGPMYYGEEAAGFTNGRVAIRKVRVVLDPKETRDRYQRLLAYVYLDEDTMLNEEIIAGGYGYADRRFDHPYMQRFIRLEEAARRQGLGLWKRVKPSQMPEWRRKYEQPSAPRH